MKKIIRWLIVLIVIGGVAVTYFFNNQDNGLPETITVEKRDVIQKVLVSGKVEPAQQVELSFNSSGRVESVLVDVGDTVSNGQTLVRLENDDLVATLLQAQANLEAEQARLEELERGSREEERALKEIAVRNAQINLNDEEALLYEKVADAFSKADDALRSSVDQLFFDASSNDLELKITMSSNSQLETDVKFERIIANTTLSEWETTIDNYTFDQDISELSTDAKLRLNDLKKLFKLASQVANEALPDNEYTQTELDGIATDISSGRATINTVLTAIVTQEENVASALANLLVAEQDLQLINAGTDEKQIAAQRARVKSAEANVLSRQAEINKGVISAPFDGIVTEIYLDEGESVTARTAVIALISDAEFEIVSAIPEVDIAKVKVGDSAELIFDAFPNDVIAGQVVKIDPAEKVVNGVSNYDTTFESEETAIEIRSGMTASIDILTGIKEQTLAIPVRSLIRKNSQTFVNVVTGEDRFEEKQITIGLLGSDGYIEVIDGLFEGQTIIANP